MSDSVNDEICQTIAEVFLLEGSAVTSESTPESIPAWDSMGHLNLVLALEQKFGVSFDPDQIPKLTSVEAIAQAVSAQKA